MERTNRSIAVLAVLLFVVIGVVGWLYVSTAGRRVVGRVLLDDPGVQAVPSNSIIQIRAMALEDQPVPITLSDDESMAVRQLSGAEPMVPRGLQSGLNPNIAIGLLSIGPDREYLIFRDGSIGVSNRSMTWDGAAVRSIAIRRCDESRTLGRQ